MDILKRFDIPFRGLSVGVHHYDFEAGDDFFSAFEDSEITGGRVTAEVELTRSANMLKLAFVIGGEVTVACDRCLDDCRLPVNYQGELVVKFSDEQLKEGEEYDGEILWLNRSETTVNIAQYIYESIVLSLPYQRVHGSDGNTQTCNPDMLGRFNIVSQEEFETITAPAEQKMEENPEWDKLRELKEKM